MTAQPAVLSDFTQSGLLDESLALLDALVPPGTGQRWWQATARQQLHDELFRYFLALPQYAVESRDYTEAPKLALLACLSPNAANVQAPHKKPPLSRPVALGLVEQGRASLRQLVALTAVYNDLVRCFGSAIVDAPVGSGAKTTARPAALLASEFLDQNNRTLPMSSPPGYDIPSKPPGGGKFETHLKVADQIEALLTKCLPFSLQGSWGVAPPRQIANYFAKLDAVDYWLITGLQQNGNLRADAANLTLWIWGLVFSFTARAYLADFLCSFTRFALPLDRLYEETRYGAKINVSLDSAGHTGWPVLTKRVYNAFTAIGLVELLTGKMLHLDSPPGDGYLKTEGAPLKTLGALDDFDRTWSGSARIHSQIVSELRPAFDTVLQFEYDPGRNVKSLVPWEPALKLDGLRQRMMSHAFAAIALPAEEKPKSVKKQSKPGKRPKIDSGPFNCCGHFITHLKLAVAEQLTKQLSARLGVSMVKKQKDFGAFVMVSCGSERWGGNQLPHYEHRDGFTFDISVPHNYLKWETGDVLESADGAAQANRKNSPKSVGKATGVPLPPMSDTSYHALGNPEDLTKDSTLAKAVPQLAAKLIRGETKDLGTLFDIFAGTPIQLTPDGKPNDDLQRPNLIGHVALALAGVRKWIYASYYEHFFALQALGALFSSSDWLKFFANETSQIARLIAGAEFYWAPLDHHNHWHVVFNKNANNKISSLGPPAVQLTNELETQLSVWDALGVDLESCATDFENRKRRMVNQSFFLSAVKEQGDILYSLIKFLSNRDKDQDRLEKIRSADFLKKIAEAIEKVSYDDIPSKVEKDYQDWVKESDLAKRHPRPKGQLPKTWKPWPSDIEAPDLTPDAPDSDDGVTDTA